MASKISFDFTPTQVEELVDRLPIEDKVRLTKKLERQTWGKRLNLLFNKIDAKRKKHPISDKEITQEVESVRRHIYGPRSR